MDYLNKHKEGITVAVIFHIAVFFILFQFGFTAPYPPPAEEGVLVDFGTSDVGMGEIEPAPTLGQEDAPPITSQNIPQTPSIKPSTPKVKVVEKTIDQEEIATQDFERTATIENQKKLEKRREQEKRDSLQKIENARLADLRRVAEQRRADSLKNVKEQSQISAINSRAKNVFGSPSGTGTGASGHGTEASSGQGTTYQPGNQGSVNGTAGANNYGDGSGTGNGSGISFNLTGRTHVSLPKPSYPGNEEGKVVVEVTVDKFGKVTKAVPGVKGSSSLNAGLLNAAKNAALSTRFNESMDAPAFQTGTITYRFTLD